MKHALAQPALKKHAFRKPAFGKHRFAVVWLALLMLFASYGANAACPYSSVQVRVQPNTSTPWNTSVTVPWGQSVHVGAFKNGSGVPVDPGSIVLYAVQGSMSQQVGLSNGWEAWWSPLHQGMWSFQAYCGGGWVGSASANYTAIDVLSYVKPGGSNGVDFSIVTDKDNPWRTFSYNNGNIGERLPGFFITKGKVIYENPERAWNFEQIIYDSTWIYLVRDTSWTAKCLDNHREAGMLLFTYENNQWVRGGRHFPRFIANGGTVATGSKYIQGVEKKLSPTDNTGQEGRWCNAEYSGTTSSQIRADLVPSLTLGNRTFIDVLKLSVVGGSGSDDAWWFAKHYGLIQFKDGNQSESHSHITDPYAIGVRIPCHPNAPCM